MAKTVTSLFQVVSLDVLIFARENLESQGVFLRGVVAFTKTCDVLDEGKFRFRESGDRSN